MKSISLIPFEESKYSHSENLVEILNNDCLLRLALDSSKKISVSEFISYNKKWSLERNAKMYIILLKDIAVGMISLSHIKEENSRIGYWLGSEHWQKGYGSFVFAYVLEEAKKFGIENISASIPKNNVASLKIWKKFGAKFEYKGDMISARIKIV